jgi:hypothetical protein
MKLHETKCGGGNEMFVCEMELKQKRVEEQKKQIDFMKQTSNKKTHKNQYHYCNNKNHVYIHD